MSQIKKTSMQLIVLLGIVFIFPSLGQAQEIWNGNFIEVTKDSLGDWTIEENQDRITESVWITRKNVQGIFNIQQENGFSHEEGSPADTEWSYGTTEEIDDLIFEPWSSAIDSIVGEMIGANMVVHLISDDIYIDIKFLEWGFTQAGGGYFKLTRATENVPLSTENAESSAVTIYPNPAINTIGVVGVNFKNSFKILSVDGAVVNSGKLNNGHIDISILSPGMYYLILDNSKLGKFIKR